MNNRASIELMRHLPPGRRRSNLSGKDVKRMVEAVKPGLDVPANLEKHADVWRLRFSFNHPKGGVIRRGITLPDETTAKWVGGYLERARNDWLERRRAQAQAKRDRAKRDMARRVLGLE